MRRFVSSVIVVLRLVAACAAAMLWRRVCTNLQGLSPASEQFVDIPPGTGTAAIGRRLVEAGVVRDELTFRAALWWTGRSRDLQAGEYRFDRAACRGRRRRAPCARRRLHAAADVSRRTDDSRDGRDVRDRAGSDAAQLSSRPLANASLIQDLDAARVRPRGVPVSGDLCVAARHAGRSASSRMMVDRFARHTRDELRRRAEARG